MKLYWEEELDEGPVDESILCKCGHDLGDHWSKDGGIEIYSQCWRENCPCELFDSA